MPITTNSVNLSVGPDTIGPIHAERAAGKFSPVEMNEFLEGSKERSQINRTMTLEMERDPILAADSKYYELNKEGQREDTALRIERLSQYIEKDGPEKFQRRLQLIAVFDPQTGTRVGVNLGLFLNCVKGNGTDEQFKFWAFTKETAYIKGLYGCFAMTELAHGSNVAGLETTAVFDKETDEFVINTPHIGATKWWIGGAAHSSTHAAVYARLIVDGKDYGVKTFVVPLRDTNHNLFPGVTTGDIGAKMGRDGIDNGWIQFSNVRVPRFFLLQKFCKVSRDGEVTLPPLEQLAYSALLHGRVSMVEDSFRVASRVSTIALRYAVGRRQFKSSKEGNGLETQLLDYPLHQRRLIPFLAYAYVVSSGAYKLEKHLGSILNKIDDDVRNGDMGSLMTSISELKTVFTDSASLKSTCTWQTAEVIDQCRQACGGHGYSSYSGFGRAYNDWVVQCTWEGDNSVLGLSYGKSLVSDLKSVLEKNKKIKFTNSFLNNAKQILSKPAVFKAELDWKTLDDAVNALEIILVKLAKSSLDILKSNGGNWEAIGLEMLTLSKLNAHRYLLTEFNIRIKNEQNQTLVPYLELLGKLYASVFAFENFAGSFLAHEVFTPSFYSSLTSSIIPQLLSAIRPHVITLTDSFQLSDMMINSAIAPYNGDVYEKYFDIVKANNPPKVTKAPYSGAIENMLNRPSVEDRERFEYSDKIGRILSK